MKAVIVHVHDIFDRRYKIVILCKPEEVDAVLANYPNTEVERFEVCDYVLNADYKRI